MKSTAEKNQCRWCGDDPNSKYVCTGCLKLFFNNLKERVDELRHFMEQEREDVY